jgi:hypothetical protein
MEIYQSGWSGLIQIYLINKALDILEDRKIIRSEEHQTGGKPKICHYIIDQTLSLVGGG